MIRLQDLPPDADPPRPIRVTFIPAKVFDNPALLQVNPEYLLWLLSLLWLEREQLLDGNRKIRPAAGSISSGNGVPSSMPLRQNWTSSGIRISQPLRRPSSTTPTGRSASSSAATGMAAIGCSIWCARGSTRARSRD
jgi:hypothetical protein